MELTAQQLRVKYVAFFLRNEDKLRPYLLIDTKNIRELSKQDVEYAVQRYNSKNRKKLKI